MVSFSPPSHDGRLDKTLLMTKTILLPSLAVAVAALIVVLASEWTTAQEPVAPPAVAGPDIVAVITADPNLTTLVSALRAAELVDTLRTRGPYTLFAPNNAAFAKLPPGALDNLLMPENKKKLAAVLKNHLLRDKIMSGDIGSGKQRTLDGGKVEIVKSDGKISYGSSTVIVADMDASNGVVHIINSVVMPD